MAELGGDQRVVVSELEGGDASDTGHPKLAMGMKTGTTLPARLRTAMAKAIVVQRQEHRPTVILDQVSDGCAVVRLRLADLTGPLATLDTPEDAA